MIVGQEINSKKTPFTFPFHDCIKAELPTLEPRKPCLLPTAGPTEAGGAEEGRRWRSIGQHQNYWSFCFQKLHTDCWVIWAFYMEWLKYFLYLNPLKPPDAGEGQRSFGQPEFYWRNCQKKVALQLQLSHKRTPGQDSSLPAFIIKSPCMVAKITSHQEKES